MSETLTHKRISKTGHDKKNGCHNLKRINQNWELTRYVYYTTDSKET